jgi:hypothetical protein
MTCSLCENDYGTSLCENECTYLMCRECINKLKSPNCPQCRGRLNIKLFISGKICIEPNMPIPCRFVVQSEEHEEIDEDEVVLTLRGEGDGAIDIQDEDIIYYDDFMNVEQELPIQQITPTTQLTGPFAIVSKTCWPMDGFWSETDFVDAKPFADIVNKRNHQAIVNCDVFVLKLNIMCDCFRSIAEWGIASALGKTLIILFTDLRDIDMHISNIDEVLTSYIYHEDGTELIKKRKRNYIKDRKFLINNSHKMQSEFYMFAVESIKTLDKLSFTKREAIFTSHPIFNITYNEYVKKLQNIIV